MCDHRFMDAFLTGFADEMVKVARGSAPEPKPSRISPRMKSSLHRAAVSGGGMAALQAILDRDASLGDIARTGAGWGGGSFGGRELARAMGGGRRSKFWLSLLGGALGSRMLRKEK